jgi:hypothetical protein
MKILHVSENVSVEFLLDFLIKYQRRFYILHLQMVTDRVYLADAAWADKLQAAVKKSPVYFFLFGYRWKHSFTEVNSGTTDNYGKRVVTMCSNTVPINHFLLTWKALTNIPRRNKTPSWFCSTLYFLNDSIFCLFLQNLGIQVIIHFKFILVISEIHLKK